MGLGFFTSIGMAAALLGAGAAVLAACGGTDPTFAPDETGLSAEQLLGKRLFEDTRLSEPPGVACASCHDSHHAFAGNNQSPVGAVALGSLPSSLGNRNTPTAMYAMFSPPFSFVDEVNEKGAIEPTPTGGQFWDGRASSLEEQARGPFLNPREMNNPDAAAVVAKVRSSSYADDFRRVYGGHALDDVDAAYVLVSRAIAAFERSTRFAPFSSRFDDYLRGQGQLTDLELRGLALFEQEEKGNCISCHAGKIDSGDPHDWLFTDFTYDALGVPRNRAIADNDDPSHYDLGLCRQEGIAARAPAGFDIQKLCGAFKVPTLRNVAKTAPYMHNGAFTSLRDVVRFYATRDTSAADFYPADADGKVERFDDLPESLRGNVNTKEAPYDRHPGEAPRLRDDEIDAIVAFLETLSDR